MAMRKTRKLLFRSITLFAFFIVLVVIPLKISVSSASFNLSWARIEKSDPWETVTDLTVSKEGNIFMIQSFEDPYNKARIRWYLKQYSNSPNNWYYNPKMGYGIPSCYQKRIAIQNLLGTTSVNIYHLWSDAANVYWCPVSKQYIGAPIWDPYANPGIDIGCDLNSLTWMIDSTGKRIKYIGKDGDWQLYSYIPYLNKYEKGISIDAVSYYQNGYKIVREIWITTNQGKIMYSKAISFPWNEYKVYKSNWYTCNYGGIKGYDIAVAPRESHNAEVWITSPNYESPTYGYAIYRLNRASRRWEKITGWADKISVMPDGNPVVANRLGDIWKGRRY